MNVTEMELTDSERAGVALCVHEAAHAVWAVLAGAQIAECSVPSADHGLVRITEPHPNGPEISYAGIYAEALFTYGGIPPLAHLRDAWRNASAGDREHFGDSPNLPRHIEPQVEYVMPRIRQLAQTLYRRGTATHADVENVLGITRDVPASVVASCVRSRLGWPVSPR